MPRATLGKAFAESKTAFAERLPSVCFTYGTWFGVKGLIAAGRTFENSPAIRKACNFLLSKELSSGGWGESYLSSQDQVNSVMSVSLK